MTIVLSEDHRDMTKNHEKMPELPEDIFARLRWGIANFSARQAALCQYVLDHYQQVAFWSVEELSQNSEISPATIVRTVKSLGYGSYHELLKCFEKLIIDNKTSIFWETEKSWDKSPEELPTLAWIVQDNVQSITDSVTPSLLADIERACELLQKANRIFIIGLRGTRAASIFLYSMLCQAFDNIEIIQYGSDELFDHLVDLGSSDVIFAMSLGGPHYTQTTIRAVRYAKQHKIPTVLVVNEVASPAVEYADVTLVAGQTRHHYSIVPTLTILEAIIVELGQRKKSAALKKLRKLEPILLEEGVTI